MRILVVDDETSILGLLSTALAGVGKVTVAAHPDDGLREAESGRFDVALIDLVMPGRSGLELVSELKTLHPGLKVILMSGSEFVEADPESNGVDVFLPKPFGMQIVCDLVRDLAGEGPDAAS